MQNWSERADVGSIALSLCQLIFRSVTAEVLSTPPCHITDIITIIVVFCRNIMNYAVEETKNVERLAGIIIVVGI